MTKLPYRLAVLTFLAFAVLATPAQADDREFVPEFDAYIKLSDRSRLFLLADLTRNSNGDATDGSVGAHIDFTLEPIWRYELREADWERNRYLWARVGYLRLGSPDNRGFGPHERRGILELTGRVPLPQNAWLVNRARVDLRELGDRFSQRFRYRLGIEREMVVRGLAMVPYAQAEIFYDTRYDSWNRRLYQAGVEIELSKRWRIEPYLASQNDSQSSSANIGRFGVALKYYR